MEDLPMRVPAKFFVFCVVAALSFVHASAASNLPPSACFSVDRASGTVKTVFQVNASCSTDDKTQASKLKIRWDWESDGTWDTTYTTTKTASHFYVSEGGKTITLQVQDTQGLEGTRTSVVSIVPPATTRGVVGVSATEPDIDVNPLDPTNIVYRPITPNNLSSGTIPFPSFASTDGGATWTQSSGPGPYQLTDPMVSFDDAGSVFIGGLVPGELSLPRS